jgi:hypothetical protein
MAWATGHEAADDGSVPGPVVKARLKALALLLMVLQGPVMAQEAWLVTYGPGSDVWERFGHNALWIRDPDLGVDHTFSFGYFELDRPGFHRDFARGIMRYFGAASSPEREFAFYRQRQRSIEKQRLNLSPGQVRQLYRLLENAIFPQPQYYQYDYYLANCSTWLRDLLDEVLEGALGEQLSEPSAHQNFRDHTRRLTADRFWMHTGMMLLLGPRIDHPRSAWDEAFLPESLAYWLDTVEVDGQPLVTERRVLFSSEVHAPPSEPTGPWAGSLLLGLLSVLLIVLPAWRRRQGWRLLPWRIGLLVVGAAGLVVLWMWLVSGHEATWRNIMVLLLNPLWWLFLLPGLPRLKRFVWWLLLPGVVIGTLLMAWPQGPQYRFDQLLWLTPLAAALLLVAWQRLNCIESSH